MNTEQKLIDGDVVFRSFATLSTLFDFLPESIARVFSGEKDWRNYDMLINNVRYNVLIQNLESDLYDLYSVIIIVTDGDVVDYYQTRADEQTIYDMLEIDPF